MQPGTYYFLLLSLTVLPFSVQSSEASPIGKVLELISDLQARLLGEGQKAQKVFEEYSEWCEERQKSLAFQLKSAKAQVADLEASIRQEAAQVQSLATKVEELAADVAMDEADMRAASFIREKEAADFSLEEKQLTEVVGTLERAIGILEKHGASMVQLKNAATVAQALSVMVQASMFSAADARRLSALVQGAQESEDEPAGAPAASAYEGHANGILDTLSDLLEKARTQLEEARKKETSNLHHFQMLKRSLQDEIAYGHKEMAEAKKASAESSGRRAAAQGDLKVTSSDLKEDQSILSSLHISCMTAAQDFEAATRSRSQELQALAEAKSAVADSTGAADSLVYGSSQVSFLQEASSDKAKALERTSEGSGLSSHADLAHFEAVRFVRDLARRQNSSDLSLLAKRMASAMRLSGGVSEDPFSKVKGLIQDMIEKLEREAGADSKHKAYCDKEISVTDQKQADKSDETGKLSTKMDRLTVREAQLKEEVADIEKSLAGLATVQADMDRIREEENAVFVTNKADLVKGLGGAKLALKILTEYYAKDGKAHNAAQGAGEGVIGLLEVCESDLSKGLAELLGAEESAKSEYDQASKDNAIQQKTKEADVKYKSKEAKDFAKSLAEVKSDRASVQTELDAVGKYLETLHSQCDEKTETYEEQARRRTAEVAGLREALEILEGEAALLQRESRRRPLLRVAKLQRPPPHKQDHIVLYTVANSLESS